MNTPIALHHHRKSHARSLWSWQLLQWLAFAAVAAWGLHVFMQPAQVDLGTDQLQKTAPVPAVVHWKDATHDWLLVVDQTTRELVVYDANSGEPLRRIGATDGTGPIDSVVGEGRWLITTSRQDPHLQILSLPDLQPAMLAIR